MLAKVLFVSCLISLALCQDVYQIATYAATDCSGPMIGVKVTGGGYTGDIQNCVELADGRSVKTFNAPINIEEYRKAPWNWYQVQDHGTCDTIDDITNSDYQSTIYIMNGTNCWTNYEGTSSFAFASCSGDQFTLLDGVSDQPNCEAGTASAAATANTCEEAAGPLAMLYMCGTDVQAPVAAPAAAPAAAPSTSNTPAAAPVKKSNASVAGLSAGALVLGAILF